MTNTTKLIQARLDSIELLQQSISTVQLLIEIDREEIEILRQVDKPEKVQETLVFIG